MTLVTIDTESWSERYRKAGIHLQDRQLLVTNFHGTEQEKDLSEPPNCGGFGRVRHFRAGDDEKWIHNPLPIEPARRAMSLPDSSGISAQVFQNAICNWRCWYCFVPFSLLNANPRHSAWLSPKQLVELYLAEPDPPPMIDLSGGQPDLTPEWIPWMIEELNRHGLSERVYLWSDDNLSNDYFWRYLTDADRQLVRSHRNYGRVGCFKGIDRESFAFNTGADAALFDNQFDLFRRFLELDLDLYAYVTFTTPNANGLEASLISFVDRLQALHPLLPLRTVPLEILPFTPVKSRVRDEHTLAMRNQYDVLRYWRRELTRRFSSEVIAKNICDVSLVLR
jgi:uncharacterized Fe-S cluster-containing radical SAM superfamily protein